MPIIHLCVKEAQEHILNVDSYLVTNIAEVGVDIAEKQCNGDLEVLFDGFHLVLWGQEVDNGATLHHGGHLIYVAKPIIVEFVIYVVHDPHDFAGVP